MKNFQSALWEGKLWLTVLLRCRIFHKKEKFFLLVFFDSFVTVSNFSQNKKNSRLHQLNQDQKGPTTTLWAQQLGTTRFLVTLTPAGVRELVWPWTSETRTLVVFIAKAQQSLLFEARRAPGHATHCESSSQSQNSVSATP